MSSEVNKLAFGDNTYTIADEVARQAINGLQTAIDTSKDVIVKGKDPLVINAYQDDITVSPGSYTSITVAGLGKDFTANNIAFGKTIGSTTGVFTAYGTATAEDIAKGKVAYVKGEEIVGTAEFSTINTDFEKLIDGSITSVNSNTTEVKPYAFYQCNKLTTINLPNLTGITDSMCENCTTLTTLTVPNVKNIASCAFKSCRKLIAIDLPKVMSLASKAFINSYIASIKLPDIQSLNMNAFEGCNATTIDLGETPSYSISKCLFKNCTKLTALILRRTNGITAISESATGDNSPFSNSGISAGTCYIYVPSALVDTYKADSLWSVYANQFRAIEDYPDICG